MTIRSKLPFSLATLPTSSLRHSAPFLVPVRGHYTGGNPQWQQRKKASWGKEQKFTAETVAQVASGWYSATSSHVHAPGGGSKWKERKNAALHNTAANPQHLSDQYERGVSSSGPVFEAAKSGWVEILKAFIDAAPTAEQRSALAASRDTEHRQSLVHYAALCTNESAGAVFDLLSKEYGRSLTEVDMHGRTALHVAAECGSLPAIRYLLKETNLSPADVASGTQRSAFHAAAIHAHAECFEYMLQETPDFDLNTMGADRWTCMHAACGRRGSLKILQLLLARGANMEIGNSGGWYPLHVASHYGHSDLVRCLLEAGADVHTLTERRDSALHHAVHSQNLESVQLLLAAGAKVDVLNAGLWSALHAVTQNGCDLQVLTAVMEATEQQGQKHLLDAVTVEGWTVLKLLAFYGRLEAAQYVVAKGAPVNMAPSQFSPLHSASCSGCVDIIKFLLSVGADLDPPNPNDWTPLHCAIDSGHEDCAQFLLSRGANPTALTNQGMTPMHFAARKGFSSTIQAIAAVSQEALSIQNGLGWAPLHVAAYWNQPSSVATLLTAGASPALLTSNGFTPLHIAVEFENEAIMWNLVQYGCPVNAADHNGRSALVVAVRKNRPRSVAMLLQVDTLDTEVADRYGTRAIDHAILKQLPGIKQQLELAGSPPSGLERSSSRLATGEKHLEVHRLIRQSRLRNKFIKVFSLHNLTMEQYRVPDPYYTARWEVAEWLHVVFGDEAMTRQDGGVTNINSSSSNRGGTQQQQPQEAKRWTAGSAIRVADGEAWIERCRAITSLLLFSVECARGSVMWQHLVRLSQLNRRNVRSTATIDHLMDEPMREVLTQFHSEVLIPKFFPLRDLLESLDVQLQLFFDQKQLADGEEDSATNDDGGQKQKSKDSSLLAKGAGNHSRGEAGDKTRLEFRGKVSWRCHWSGRTEVLAEDFKARSMEDLCSKMRHEVVELLQRLQQQDVIEAEGSSGATRTSVTIL